ncbi:MAG: MFS transporter [Acidobacteria bacterium]|nr:MFS transporter [Acidobacteriota bacterium]
MSRSVDVVPYRTLLRLPGALPTFIASSLGRLSYGTVGLALVLAVQHASGSFAVAGLSSASYGVGTLSAPVKSRWIDRYGQRRLIALFGMVSSGTLLSLAIVAERGVRNSAAYAFLAGLTGLFSPPLGPAVRAVWAVLIEGVATRQRAYSFDVGVEDTLFTVGPLIVGGLVLLDGPTLALVVAAGLMFVGSVLFARSPAVAIHDQHAAVHRGTSLAKTLRSPGFAILLSIVIALSTSLGLVDVSVAARAVENGTPAAAGYVLAAMTLGSVIGGQLWGRRNRSGSVPAQLVRFSVVLTICLAGAAVAPDLAVLTVVVAVFGTVIAPVLVISFVAAEKLGSESGRAETSAWINTASNLGVAMGSALGGVVIVRSGSTDAFMLGTAISVAAFVLIISVGPRLARSLGRSAP